MTFTNSVQKSILGPPPPPPPQVHSSFSQCSTLCLQSLFSDFMRDVLDKGGTLEDSLLKQVINNNGSNGSNSVVASRMPPDGPIPGPSTRLAHHLAELQEVLATLLVYYSSTGHSPSPATFRSLVQLAQVGD